MSGFRIGLTRDFLNDSGQLVYKDIGLNILEEAGLEYLFLDRDEPLVTPDLLENLDGIISLTPQYTCKSLEGLDRLVAIARFGVGYDNVDVNACTKADVALFISKGMVNYSVAEAVVTWMLALSHRILNKDHLVRTGSWTERSGYMGTELRDRTVGIIGAGGIGCTLARLLALFKIKEIIAYDPYIELDKVLDVGVRLVDLECLLRESDFISINCPLTDTTRNLLGIEEFALMKPTAYLINTARGGILNEDALFEALKSRQIAGAAMDVFEKEPVGADHPFSKLDNVILAPHSIAWTDELFRDIGQMNCRQMVSIARGEVPEGLINFEVLKHNNFLKKLARFR